MNFFKDYKLYLLNISLSGIKCLKDKIQLNFYKKTVNSDFNPDSYRIKSIYGENGSGKSGIITAVKIFRDILVNEHYLSETKTQSFLDEIINKKTKKFEFNCEFIVYVDNVYAVYNYSIELGKNEKNIYDIQREKLEVKNGAYMNRNYKTVFETKKGELVYLNASYENREWLLKKSFNLLKLNSFVNIAFDAISEEQEHKDEKLYEEELVDSLFYCYLLCFNIKIYLAEEDQHEMYFLKKMFKNNDMDENTFKRHLYGIQEYANPMFSVNEKLVHKMFYNIYEKQVKRLERFIKIFKPELKSIEIEKKRNDKYYECELNLNYGDYIINKEFESTGIKKLMRLYECFAAVSANGIVFIDELDSNLNDVYLCKLIEYFMYYGKGQLCFTTHNLDPMLVLKNNKNSIEFLSNEGKLISWTTKGNASPDNYYRNGMIRDIPFNVDATDFLGIFGE